jgi:hypothetical protein
MEPKSNLNCILSCVGCIGYPPRNPTQNPKNTQSGSLAPYTFIYINTERHYSIRRRGVINETSTTTRQRIFPQYSVNRIYEQKLVE